MRKRTIAGNWKMNNDRKNTEKFCDEIIPLLKEIGSDIEIIICPPFTSIDIAQKKLNDINVQVGAQNMHFEDSGAYTGELSPLMLKELGIEYVILGHSERRQYFYETNDIINKKIKKALSSGLKPIVCIGENLEERENEMTKDIILAQMDECLAGLNKDEIKQIVIAYEPIWAIGTGKTASPQQAQEIHAYIRKIIKGIYDENTSQAIRILYGGSMKPENAKELLEQQDIDGGLIGGASLVAETFSKIIKC